jgi:hypothetical protein
VKDQHSTSGDRKEPVRPSTIPDDFIWDPEIEAWYAPGEPSGFDVEAWMRDFNNLPEEVRRGGLITRDQLLAAGALDCPPEWRKSLGGGKREVLPLFPDDDDGFAEPDATDNDTEFNSSSGEAH